MARWVNIVGEQCNDTLSQHDQRPQEWAPRNVLVNITVQWSIYDTAALTV